jgi:hypothetical protein
MMPDQLFPYSHIVAGVMVLLVGFTFHWVGQLVSLVNWDFATRIGLQDKGAPPEFLVYERGTAVADVTIGWVYGVAGVGLLLGTPWGFKLAWIPGAVLIYHGISAWFWFGNQTKSGHRLHSEGMRMAWCAANVVAGALAITVAWYAT